MGQKFNINSLAICFLSVNNKNTAQDYFVYIHRFLCNTFTFVTKNNKRYISMENTT